MNEPLAYRMRPKTLDKVLGQKKLVSKGGFLYNCIEANSAVNMIFFGPSGSGKTTIAEAFANSMKMNFIKLNATINKKEELLDAINQSRLIFSLSIARFRPINISSLSNGIISISLVLDLIALLMDKRGLAVVAPIKINCPFSKKGKSISCLSLFNR